MIRVTDRTLSCLDGFSPSGDALRGFARYLVEMGADRIELSEYAYGAMGVLPEGGKYTLRLQSADNAAKYRELDRFVCRAAFESPADGVVPEIVVNDIRERQTLTRYAGSGAIRIRGLDDVMLGNYQNAFARLRELFHGALDLCPTNRSGCATAAAVEWIAAGGTDVVTSFGGIGGFAATEEVVMYLRLQRVRRAGKSYECFPEMRRAAQEITGRRFSPSKPIIGERIFAVESGVHVDGIMKQPKCYEPYPPEIVGQTRTITLGRQSGASSIRVKLAERGITATPARIAQLLYAVKERSVTYNRAVSDDEFFDML
jgi:homocitrate synthase NifV